MKRRNGLKIMLSLFSLVGSFSFIILLAVINGILGFFSAMGVTLFASLAIAKFLGESIILSYGWLIALTILCGVVRGGLRYLEQYSNHYIAFRLLAIIRDKIFRALRVLAPAKLEGKKKGGIISMITSDIETLEVFYAHTISPICIAAVVSLGVILYVGILCNWYLSGVALISYIIIGIILPIISSKILSRDGVKYREELSNFSSYYLDSIKGVREIVMHDGVERRKECVNNMSKDLLDQTKIIKHKSATSKAIVEALVSISILSTLLVGIYLYNKDIITIPKLIIGAVAIFSSFGPVVALSALPQNLTNTFASGDRVLNLLKEKPEVNNIINGYDISFNNLKINDLSFAYDNKLVLDNINMSVKNGEIVGIVGPSGCGKSTILKLLLRFYKKSGGSILYDDKDIEEVNTHSLLDNVTMVSQTTYLFDDTILNNIKIARLDATLDEVREACKMASIDEFISSLPDKYETRVGNLGENLSQGERQRIGLARAFLRGSRLILLDEVTSNVDSINEGVILKSLVMQKQKRSIILVSHRPSSMSIADRVYKIDDGKLREVEREFR